MGDEMNIHRLKAMGIADQEIPTHQSKKLETRDVRVFTYDELKCATMGFGYKTCLGDWCFGKVYKGGWVDANTFSPTQHGKGLAIVVKTFHHHHSKTIYNSKLDLVLRKLSHPNLVKLIGHCFEGELLFLVEEFHYGNFEDCLRYGAISRLQLDIKVKMAVGIARAIVFLHQTRYDHTASSCTCADGMFLFERCNILLDEDFNAKISDYNVSTFRPWPRSGSDCNIDHPKHSPPPSIFAWNNLTSFTILLAEILTGEIVSETNPLMKMNDLCHNREILDDPKLLGSVANICFAICNDADSESKMLMLLNKFNNHI